MNVQSGSSPACYVGSLFIVPPPLSKHARVPALVSSHSEGLYPQHFQQPSDTLITPLQQHVQCIFHSVSQVIRAT